MDKQNHNDIAAFPELFDGLEQFIEEQASGLKRTSAILAASGHGRRHAAFLRPQQNCLNKKSRRSGIFY